MVKTKEPIFAGDIDWKNNACLNFSNDSTEFYAVGYKDAGDVIAERVISTGRNQDILIYPLVFLYRQYIELRLKEIIREARLLLEEEGDSYYHHNIDKLWKTVKPLVEEAFQNEPEPLDLDYAEHVITEFSKIDPGSFSFRYSTGKKEEKSLKGVKHINIRRVAEHVNKLSKDLETISLGISVYMERKQDMMEENG